MKIIKKIVLFSIFICLIEAKVKIKVTIYDYSNHNNLMHDGRKCENFHWAGDHCDPMFKICVYHRYKCDLISATTRFWANDKYVWHVYSDSIVLDNFPTSIYIKVTADDHDRYDAHDHIGIFTANFYPRSRNFNSNLQMQYGPRYLDIKLKARVQIECADNYYGSLCENYCYPSGTFKCSYSGMKICSPNYYGRYCNNYCVPSRRHGCNPITGAKTCKDDCGNFGKCIHFFHSAMYFCKCMEGWYGSFCAIPISTSTPNHLRTTKSYSTSTTKKLTTYTLSEYLTKSYSTSTTKNLTTYSRNEYLTKKPTFHFISTTKPQIPTITTSLIDSTIYLSSSLTSKKEKLVTSTQKVKVNKISSHSLAKMSTLLRKSTNFYYNDTKKTYKNKSSSKLLSKIVSSSSQIHWDNHGKKERLRALSKLSEKSSERYSIKFEISIYQIIYGIAIILLICIALILLAKLWKAKYKMKYLLSNSSRRLPQVIFTPNMCDTNSLHFNGKENSNFHIGSDSVYDSCTLTTNLNDEVVYEEPISRNLNRVTF